MDCKVEVWAVDISNFRLWKDEVVKDDGLIDTFLPTKDEQDKVRRYVREIDQIRSLTGKILAHHAVCSTFKDVSWNDVRFQVGQSGRPYLAKPQYPFDYNITHDGDWVAIAFTRRPSLQESPPSVPSIGIDVMEIHLPPFEQDSASFVETMEITLTENEQRWILDPQSEMHIVPLLSCHPGVHMHLQGLHTLRILARAIFPPTKCYMLRGSLWGETQNHKHKTHTEWSENLLLSLSNALTNEINPKSHCAVPAE